MARGDVSIRSMNVFVAVYLRSGKCDPLGGAPFHQWSRDSPCRLANVSLASPRYRGGVIGKNVEQDSPRFSL